MCNKVGIQRRKFLKLMAAGTAAAATGQILRPLGSNIAHAQAAGGSRVLIIVNFSGGISHNWANPFNPAYLDRNPTIAYGPGEAHTLNAAQGLHPSLNNLKAVYDAGDLAMVNMVGYPSHNRSHDESTTIKFRGVRSESAGVSDGFGSRLTCQMPSVYAGVSLSGASQLSQGTCNPIRALQGLDALGLKRWGSSTQMDWRSITEINMRQDSSAPVNASQAYVKGNMDRLQVTLETLRQQADITLPVAFPNSSFGRACRDAAKLVAARSLGTQVIFINRGGFDTHANERTSLTNSLNDVDASLGAMVSAIQGLGRWNDVAIASISEFCRTHENGSGGSDHGHAGPAFVMGGLVRGGVKNSPASTAEINSGNYLGNYHVDYRVPFREIVTYFLRLNPDLVFPEPISYGNGFLGIF